MSFDKFDEGKGNLESWRDYQRYVALILLKIKKSYLNLNITPYLRLRTNNQNKPKHGKNVSGKKIVGHKN